MKIGPRRNNPHTPVRQCIGCRRRRPKRELVRLRASGDRAVLSGRGDPEPQRGCYVCPEESCVTAALKQGRVSRALRRNIGALPSREEILSLARTKGETG